MLSGVKVMALASELRETIIEDYKFLHQCPGVGFDISETYEYVKNRLVEIGCVPAKCGKSGLIVDMGNTNDDENGKCILLRADMDGLMLKEESGLEYASRNGRIHACGHDMHTAMLLGAARILKQYEKEINGRIRLMFQPAEEILEGAKDMIASEVLKNPKVDAGIMLHVMTALPFECGTVVVSSPGVSAPAADYFSIRVKGVGGHGAMPEKAIDPLNIGAHILLALQNINSRELPSGERAVVTIGSISSGEAYNIIPDEIIMRGTMRAFDEEVRGFIKERIIVISEGVAGGFRGSAQVSFDRGCPTLLNDKNLSCYIEKSMVELLGKEKVFTTNELSKGKSNGGSGSEDFAYISHEIPAVMLGLVAGHSEKGYEHNLHHPKVKFDLDALAYGAAVYAYAGMSLL